MTISPHPPLQEFYDEPAQRESAVRKIFDEGAPWYERATQFISFGSGSRYRREALERAGLKPGMRVLDIATGTGVVAREAAKVTKDRKAITGLDPSFGMLAAGRVKAMLTNVQSGAESLPFRDASFDLITIGFAMRHFADLKRVFTECARVLRPGGRLLILEITAPESRVGRSILGAWLGGIVPALIGLITFSAKTSRMMRYYWVTTRECVRPEVIVDAMRSSGFSEAGRHVELGIFSEYSGLK
jgi:demethylmenaquinone methyltransferase / 2-methoxy-6-polyprenyl-1,4-benzoquinol methylase